MNSYTEKVITKQVIDIIKIYKIEKYLRYFIFNNITNNNKYIKVILNIL